MRAGLVPLLSALTLVVSGCGDEGSQQAGLEARLLETPADEVHSGPAGVFALDGADLVPIDAESGAPAADPIDVGALNARVAVGEEAAWTVEANADRAARIDLSSNSREPLELPGQDLAPTVAATSGGAWIVVGRRLVPYAADGTPMKSIGLPCGATELAVSNHSVWGACERGLVHVDTQEHSTQMVDVGGEPADIAATGGSAWALVGRRLIQVGTEGERMRTVKVAAATESIAGEGNDLWLVTGTEDAPELVALHDGRTGERTAGPVELAGSTDDVPAAAQVVAPYRGSLWFALAFYGGPLGVVEPDG